jgi:choice-of-anchor B domain-containing protein
MRLPILLFAAALAGAPALAQPTPQAAPGECAEGAVSGHPCSGVDLLAHITLETFDAASGNDIWGWTDPETGREYALAGLDNGTAFVDVTDPAAPVYLGKLPTHTDPSTWRDMKVYADHAFIVSEAPGHGMQVFDLTRLRNVQGAPTTFTADAHYGGVSNTHNIAINEEAGFAYLVGTNECAGGLHIVNIQDPMNPTFAGCYDEDGYTHDTQCVTYRGPDTDYTGRLICASSNEDTVTITDVTDPASPVTVARATYPSPAYTHQGWFTEDQRYFLADDELDESQGITDRTRTLLFDFNDLDAPELLGTYLAPVPSIDHNLYVKGDRAYAANYTSGLRVLDVSRIGEGRVTEVAFFDSFPANDETGFSGAWSVYPYFRSGTIVVQDIQGGLFIVKEGEQTLLGLSTFTVTPGEGTALLAFEPAADGGPFTVERRFEGRDFEVVGTVAAGGPYTFSDTGLPPGTYTYRLRRTADGRELTSVASTAEVDGPPVFRVSAATANPFEGETSLSLTVTEAQPVEVTLVDEAGNALRVLHDGAVAAERPLTVSVSGASLAPGTYYVRFAGETFDAARKLVRTRPATMGTR